MYASTAAAALAGITEANQDKLRSQQTQLCSWLWVGGLLQLPQMLQLFCIEQKIHMSDLKVETCTFALPGFGTSRGAVIALAFLEESCPLSRCENAFQANAELLSTVTEVWKAARPHLGLQLWQEGRLQ